MRKNRRTDEKLSLRLGTLVPTQGFTQSLTRSLTSGVTSTSGFDPLSLNPIIAYEMHESMMAPLASESLDLDPANPSSLDIITATRAGTATYTDASGNIQTASPNTVRVDHVDGVPMILVEPAATNLVSYTDFSSGWVNNGSSDVAGSGYSGQPSVVITGTQSNASLFFYCPAVVGQEYIISMYIRRVSGTGTIRMRHVYAVEGVATDVTITNDWSRVEVPFTANSTSIPIGPQIQVSGESVEIAMPQVEEGTVATSYIPTSGSAVTRAADVLVIDGSDFTDFYNDAEGTVYVESTGRGYFDYNTSFAFSDNSSSNRIYARSSSNSSGLTVFSGGSVSASMGGLTVVANNVLSRSAHSFKANNFLTSRDGNSATPDTSGNMPVGIDRLYIGAGQTGGKQLNGHIKRLIYWPYHSDNL